MVSPYGHNPRDIATFFIGPHVPSNYTQERTKETFTNSKTFSYVPNALLYERFHPYFIYHNIPVEQYMMRPLPSVEVIMSLKKDIKDQFETKIQIFCLQLFMFYRTGLIFAESYGANAQMGMPGSDAYKYTPEPYRNERTCASAHSADIASVRILSTTPNHEILFGEGSSFHRICNSTVWVPDELNKVDSAFDSNIFFEKKFREHCLNILQDTSYSRNNPHQALLTFLSTAENVLNILENKYREFPDNESYARKALMVSFYRSAARKLRVQLEQNDELVKKWNTEVNSTLYGEDFYMSVQARMHQQFKSEMELLRNSPTFMAPTPTPPPTVLVQPLDYNSLRSYDHLIYLINQTVLPATAQAYVQKCLNQANCIAELKWYVQNTSLQNIGHDMYCLKTKNFHILSPQASSLHKNISAFLGSRIHHLNDIIAALISNAVSNRQSFGMY